jgi:hypothetical protein
MHFRKQLIPANQGLESRSQPDGLACNFRPLVGQFQLVYSLDQKAAPVSQGGARAQRTGECGPG